MTTSLDAQRVATARELAGLLSIARHFWGIPDAAPRSYAPSEPPDPRLAEIIDCYRAGMPLDAIARRMGISRSVVDNRIAHARRDGSWPAELRRKYGGRHGQEG